MSGAHRHDLLLYDDGDQLAAALGAVLGREAGDDDLVVLACRERHEEALAEVSDGPRAPLSLPRPVVRLRPVVALAAQRRLAREHAVAGGRVWYVAEPDHGGTPDERYEAVRYEAACSLSLARVPLSTVCAYPRRDTPEPLLDLLLRTHPRLLTPRGPVDNPAFRDPAGVVAALHRPVHRPVPAVRPVFRESAVVALSDVAAVRARLAAALRPLPTLVRTDFVAAVNEVLANACVHGVPPVEVAVWVTPTRVECRVTDRGAGFVDPLAGFSVEPDDVRTRAGLWLARQACDELDGWPSGGRFTVRLATGVGPERALQTHGALARAETARARVAHAHRFRGGR
ncbi:hypothetical protein Val02_36100 [Virgisporangium aliadipatigenens]|uniref:Anti-sigma regulatory factor (Ser/Thr protein kinase) n=1 Tax=Virgisporangium aliadipatigenens TaxID=741659 RepID=A0A8J3YJT8_9ACTN|nr:MEDS domain-containing protein [Virgisporangium aliadipatigenens]GIJ46724.1 hypothetical protein Val02_36100 [Virgisporangium aliadipatigenens]